MGYEHFYEIKDRDLRIIEEDVHVAYTMRIKSEIRLKHAKDRLNDYTKNLCKNKARTLGLTKENGYSDVFDTTLDSFKVIFKPKTMIFKVDMKTSQIRPGKAIDDLKED